MSSWRCFFSRRVEAVILERKSPVVILTMSSSTVPHLRIPPALPRHAGKWDPLGDGWILHPATRPSIPFSMQAVAVRCIKGWIAGCNRGFAGRLGATLRGFGFLPGTLRTFRFREITVAHPVVHIGFAHRAQAFVVETDGAASLLQFLGEIVQRFQAIGRSGVFGFAGLEYLLISVVHQLGDLARDHVAGVGEDLYSAILGALDGG